MAARPDDDGTDVYLSLVNLGFDPAQPQPPSAGAAAAAAPSMSPGLSLLLSYGDDASDEAE